MKRLFMLLVSFFCILFLANSVLFAQGKRYEGPEDPAGDIAAEREGYMTGNRVFLYFRNTTELSDWPKVEVSRWPNNYEGVKMLDGIALLVGALVFVDKNSVPVTDPLEIARRKDLDTLYFLQTSYREEMDRDPTGTVEWGLYPVFGYFNENSEYPAMSNLPTSWPPMGWPARGRDLKWPGEWDGRFGRGVIYADLETYFVANDAQDQEYLGPEDIVKYYPRPGRKIGDIRPNTRQNGLPWGGLGIRVELRGFQWNNPQARDAIFWEYSIANISDYDLTQVAFGYWVDNAIGSDSDDELGFFDRKIDLAYSWDIDGIGRGGLRTGTMGFAYLESPGLFTNGIDDDEDGLIDERRDLPATRKIGPTEGIANLKAFLDYYKLDLEDLREHWDADEDQDWEDGIDTNGDGIYQLGEYAGDDVGLDGVGPAELNYTGPDQGECNHMPDYVEGVGCEPNFNETDVTEADMVGLTSFMLFPVPSHSPPYRRWFRNDKSMWQVVGSDTLIEYLGNISNLIEVFASGPFPLYQGLVERISMSELHAYDALEGLNSPSHSAPALYEQKRIVQVIYERDYRFAQPPKMPTLHATPGDGYVILTWDNIADTRTRDPFVNNANDFEGYKLFRATDKKMQDAEVITDGYGTPLMKKPIFQCDLIDGKRGFTNFGLVNGMAYNLGDDTGIVHYFIDRNVQNGRTYYYGLVAYDYGAPDIGPGIAPSENMVTIDLDEADEVRSIGQNVQIVTPRQTAAGYLPSTVEIDASGVKYGTGTVTPSILSDGALKDGHSYRVTFKVDTLETLSGYERGYRYTNSGFYVYDLSEKQLAYSETPQNFAFDNLVYNDTTKHWSFRPGGPITTDVFDGLTFTLNTVNEPSLNLFKSGWVVGKGAMRITPTTTESKFLAWDYDVVFTDRPDAYKTLCKSKAAIRDENNVRLLANQVLLTESFGFYVVNKMQVDKNGNYEVMDMVVQDVNQNAKFDLLNDRVLVGPLKAQDRWAGTAFVIDFQTAFVQENLPKPGDVYRIAFQRPFTQTDSLLIKVKKAEGIDRKELKMTMENIKVVPNPYVATNAMEPVVLNWLLNQRRQLMFTHIPARCSIKIFTSSGVLVDQIDVENPSDNGTAFWDLVSKEGLDIAAGVYVYHVKALDTGDEKIGKFAVVK